MYFPPNATFADQHVPGSLHTTAKGKSLRLYTFGSPRLGACSAPLHPRLPIFPATETVAAHSLVLPLRLKH
jgi:hypothetical protein